MAISLIFSVRQRASGRLLAACCVVFFAACSAGVSKEVKKKSNTRLELAKDFLRKGQLDAAETDAQKALAYHKGNAEAHHVLGLIDLMRGLSVHRLLEIDECLTGVDAEALQAEKEQHLRDADVHFARATKLEPEFGEPWASRGTLANLLEDHDSAITYLKRALELPARLQNIALVRANLGWAYFHKRDLVAAAKELLQASQFQPGMCVATYRLGRVYFARKEWEKALQKFREVAGQSACPIQDAHLFIMKTYVELGMATELPTAEQACVKLAPRSCVAAQCRTVAASVSTAGLGGP